MGFRPRPHLRGWTIDADNFQTSARNWLDHRNIGECNLCWSLSWNSALIQGWELTLCSPRIWRRLQAHLAYSKQIAQAAGAFTGGLMCPTPAPAGCEPEHGPSAVHARHPRPWGLSAWGYERRPHVLEELRGGEKYRLWRIAESCSTTASPSEDCMSTTLDSSMWSSAGDFTTE